ncbi:MAG: LLM class F420-dependent oxidoreductase [Candidatus Tectimicrobiota bacterium]|nr:MAG: LLM class F420-dependent oxidoreductase [Candidatus Tectomicrobia bacterium]
MTQLRFGVHTGQQNCSLDELRRLWRYLDGAGFDWISVWDHFYESPPVDGSGDAFEAVSALTLLATETRQVRVGCLVFCMGYRHPAVLAKALVTIDHASHGRLEVGLGAGWHEPEYRGYGIPFPPIKERLDLLEEGIQVIRALLNNERSTFRGKYFSLHDAACNPKPVQRPLPLWIGGNGEKRTLRLAARYADGWNGPYISPETFRHKCQVLDRWCEAEGRDPATLVRTVNVGFYMATDAAKARALRRTLEAQWGSAFATRAEGFLMGTVQETIDRLGAYREAGAARVNIALRAPFDWEALQAYVEEVMPAFR